MRRFAICGCDAYLRHMRSTFEPCIPTSGKAVPARPEWFHEIKYDGLYEASRVKKFFEIKHFFKRLASRERSSALMVHGRLICLAALSGQPPEPGGSRRRREGLTAEARAELRSVPAITTLQMYVFC